MGFTEDPRGHDPTSRSVFWAEGFVVPTGLALPIPHLEDVKCAMRARVEEQADLSQTLEVHNVRGELPAVAHLMRLCTPIAHELTGRDDVRCTYDEVLVSPPGLACGTPWHQDEASSRLGRLGLQLGFRRPDTSLTFWIPLQHVSADNGALRYLPGSHRAGLLRHERTDSGQNFLPNIDTGSSVTVELNAGQCVVHQGEVIHGANPNPSSAARWAVGLQFRPGGSSFVQHRTDAGGWPQQGARKHA
jgi:ectoine hydroxylase-related dioxygenase (phytanoyl-CoA dioxygenase family)